MSSLLKASRSVRMRTAICSRMAERADEESQSAEANTGYSDCLSSKFEIHLEAAGIQVELIMMTFVMFCHIQHNISLSTIST